MMEAKTWLKDGYDPIEQTELEFRVHVPAKNSLLIHDIEKRTMYDFMEEFKDQALKEICEEIEEMNGILSFKEDTTLIDRKDTLEIIKKRIT